MRRLPPDIAELLIGIKTGYPACSVRQVIQRARDEGVPETQTLAPSTVHRLLSREGLLAKPADAPGADRRRFAYRHAGQLWMTDVMHGPKVPDGRTRRKTYLIAFIDDATRVIPFAAFDWSENTAAFFPVFKQALIRRGLPQRLYVENVARHIFDKLCPVRLCAESLAGARKIRGRPNFWTHNLQSDFSHFSSVGSSRQIALLRPAPSECTGGAHASRAFSFMAMVISA